MSMDVSKVDNLLAQMRAAVAAAQNQPATTAKTATDFAHALRHSLDAVNHTQHQADAMQKAFVLGDDSVSLSDTMIAMQKADLSFKTAIQTRNKMVAAYNDIMNMQV